MAKKNLDLNFKGEEVLFDCLYASVMDIKNIKLFDCPLDGSCCDESCGDHYQKIKEKYKIN